MDLSGSSTFGIPGAQEDFLVDSTADTAETSMDEGPVAAVSFGKIGKPRFPLKGSFKGDMDIDIWLSGLLLRNLNINLP